MEYQVLRTLDNSHPNILHVYDYNTKFSCNVNGLDSKVAAVVTEYIESGDLFCYMNVYYKNGIQPLEDWVWMIARQLISALKELQHREIVHLDIKPHNLMMKSPEVIKLMDFGLSFCKSIHKP